MWRFVVCIFFVLCEACGQTSHQPSVHPNEKAASLSKVLTERAIRIYELEKGIVDLYGAAYPEYGEAGEGLPGILYTDVLLILDRAIRQDSTNIEPRVWKCDVLWEKAQLGEGYWNEALILEADSILNRLGRGIEGNAKAVELRDRTNRHLRRGR